MCDWEKDETALNAAKAAAGIPDDVCIGGVPVFGCPKSGWVDMDFAGCRYQASYITSIMLDTLDALTTYLKDGTGAGFQVNCEEGGEVILWLENGCITTYHSLGWDTGYEDYDEDDMAPSSHDDDGEKDGGVASLRGRELAKRYVGDFVLRGVAAQVLLDIAENAEEWCDWDYRNRSSEFEQMRHRLIRGVRNLSDALGLPEDSPMRVLPMVALKSADYGRYNEWLRECVQHETDSPVIDVDVDANTSLDDLLNMIYNLNDAQDGSGNDTSEDDSMDDGDSDTDEASVASVDRQAISRRIRVASKHEEGTNPMSNAYGRDTQIGDEGEFRSIAGSSAKVFATPAYGWTHMLVCGACLPASYVGSSNPLAETMKAITDVLTDGGMQRIEIDGEDAGFWTVTISPDRIAVYEYTDDQDGREPVREQAVSLDDIHTIGMDILSDVTRDAVAWLAWDSVVRGYDDDWMRTRLEDDKNELLGALGSLIEAIGTPEGKESGQRAIEVVYDTTVEQVAALADE